MTAHCRSARAGVQFMQRLRIEGVNPACGRLGGSESAQTEMFRGVAAKKERLRRKMSVLLRPVAPERVVLRSRLDFLLLGLLGQKSASFPPARNQTTIPNVLGESAAIGARTCVVHCLPISTVGCPLGCPL